MTLLGSSEASQRVATTDNNGTFLFSDLPAGTYRLRVTGVSLETWTSDPLILGAGERREMPILTTGIPTSTTTVHVNASVHDIAVAQVQQEEKQRMLMGVLPNFYSVYWWDAAPMSPALKFKLAFRSAIDPLAFITAAAVAGAEQYHNTLPGYGQESEGYGKRFGAAYADQAIGRLMGSAVFPTILRQDPRYFYRGSGSTRTRIVYALLATVICRGDNGKLQPNYSHILGSFSAAGIANIYHSSGDRSAGLTIRNGFIITGGAAATNLIREFVSRKISSNVPAAANGKP